MTPAATLRHCRRARTRLPSTPQSQRPHPCSMTSTQRQPPGKQLKGNASRPQGQGSWPHSVRVVKRCWQSKEQVTPASGSQVARAGVKGQKDDGLLGKMRAKLAGSQFRWLNEQLYTCPGSQAFELMQEQPQLFDAVP